MKNADIYDIHPSSELQRLFKERPYQGQAPSKASLVIFGLDANYSPALTSGVPFFERILEYHEDGVKFWQENEDGVHHPFLLQSYPFNKNTGGVPYHRKFSNLGLQKNCAEEVSFVELMDVPTIGRSGAHPRKYKNMLNKEYLHSLEETLLGSQKKLVLINPSLVKLIHEISKDINRFTFFSKKLGDARIYTHIKINDTCSCFVGYHFSAPKKLEEEIIEPIKKAIKEHCPHIY